MTIKFKQIISIITIVMVMAMVIMALIPIPHRGDVLKDILYSSIVWVESKGDVDVVSRDGSVGIIQIKPVMVREVNRICKLKGVEKQFTLKDRFDADKSKEMFWIYQEFYHPTINWNDITLVYMESIARKWNGGPNGNKKRSTRKYWKKVIARFNLEIESRNLAHFL